MDYDTLWANILTTNPLHHPLRHQNLHPSPNQTSLHPHLSRFCNGDKHVIALLERARDILLDPIRRQICEEGLQRKAKEKAESESKNRCWAVRGGGGAALHWTSRRWG